MNFIHLLTWISLSLTGLSSSLHLELILRNDRSVCAADYWFAPNTASHTMEYKTLISEDWQRISLDSAAGQVMISELLPDTPYMFRLSWTDGSGDTLHSESKFIKTFKRLDNEPHETVNYKIIRSTSEHEVYKHLLYRNRITFSYKDQYHSESNLLGEIFNERQNVAGNFFIARSDDGLYHIDIFKINYQWVPDETYTFRLYDHKNIERFFKIVLKEPAGELEASISPLTHQVNCEPGEKSIIRYTADITGDNKPFDVYWSVSTLTTGDQLISPQQQMVRNDEVASITVELPLPYVVTLSVFDCCGLFDETSLIVQCDDSSAPENSVLFEIINTTGQSNN